MPADKLGEVEAQRRAAQQWLAEQPWQLALVQSNRRGRAGARPRLSARLRRKQAAAEHER
jgi:hypothetical protein